MGTIKDRNSVYLLDAEEMERIHGRTIKNNILMNWITMMVWSVT